MASRSILAWFVLLIGLSAAIFFFAVDQDETALTVVFLTVYCTVVIFYFQKVLYYIECNATLNEFYFVLGANVIPIVILIVGPMFPISQAKILELNIEALIYNSSSILSITMVSVLALPYLVVSTALLVRCFTKYEFIRMTSQSTKGPSSEWTAISIYFIFGSIFWITGLISADLVGVLTGLFYLFSGVAFFVGK